MAAHRARRHERRVTFDIVVMPDAVDRRRRRRRRSPRTPIRTLADRRPRQRHVPGRVRPSRRSRRAPSALVTIAPGRPVAAVSAGRERERPRHLHLHPRRRRRLGRHGDGGRHDHAGQRRPRRRRRHAHGQGQWRGEGRQRPRQRHRRRRRHAPRHRDEPSTKGTVDDHRWRHRRSPTSRDTDETGADSFTYTVSDGHGGTATGHRRPSRSPTTSRRSPATTR